MVNTIYTDERMTEFWYRKTKWFAVAVVRFPLTKSSTTFANMIKPPKSNTHECIVNERTNKEEEKKHLATIATTTNKTIDHSKCFSIWCNSKVKCGNEIWKMASLFTVYSIYAFLLNWKKRKKRRENELFWMRAQNRKSKKQTHSQIEFIQFSNFRKYLE